MEVLGAQILLKHAYTQVRKQEQEKKRSWLCHLMNKYLLPAGHCVGTKGTVKLVLLWRRKGKEGSEVGVGRRLRCDVHWRCSH